MTLGGLCKKFPYTGLKNWALFCSLTFIIVQLLWYLSSSVRSCDFLEIPMVILFFPLASLIDPHDGMLRDENIYYYALGYWVSIFFLSWLLSRRKIHPAIPGLVLVLLSCIPGVIYALYLLWRGPILMP